MIEVTFKDFSNVARRRGHNPESLTALFRGKIESRGNFSSAYMSCKYKSADCGDMLVAYRSVIDFYRQEENYLTDSNARHNTCACGCRRPVFYRKKWTGLACRKRTQRANVAELDFASS